MPVFQIHGNIDQLHKKHMNKFKCSWNKKYLLQILLKTISLYIPIVPGNLVWGDFPSFKCVKSLILQSLQHLLRGNMSPQLSLLLEKLESFQLL